MKVDIFAQRIEGIHGQLSELYRGAAGWVQPQSELLAAAFKELAIASEALQVAVEELCQQNEELAGARAALEAERQRYQDLFEFAPDAYLVTDVRGTIRETNRAAAALLNLSQQYLQGKPLTVFIPKQERQCFHSQLSQLQQGEPLLEWAGPLLPRNGDPVEVAIKVAAVCGREGNAFALRWLLREIGSPAPAAAGQTHSHPSFDRPSHIYSKGEIIPLHPQAIWLVSEGLVKLSTLCDGGEEVLLGLAGPEMLFGSSLTALAVYQATALSDEVHLACVSLPEIAACPNLARAILPQIKQRLRQTELLLAISGRRRVKDRLHTLLRLLKEQIGEPVAEGTRLSVRLTHEEIASACGTTRVTVTRTLNQLQQEGKIILDAKHHLILKNGVF